MSAYLEKAARRQIERDNLAELLTDFEAADGAADLLQRAGLHGHKYAIDAMLCATATQYSGDITILTSDVEDIATLTSEYPRIVGEKI